MSSLPSEPKPPPVRKTFELKDCYARVQAERIFQKVSVGTEEGSMNALNMEPGGAQHFLNANRMYEYIGRNKKHLSDPVTLVVPGLREVYKSLGVVAGPSLPGPTIEAVQGTIGFQTLKNMDEYRVGELYNVDVLHIGAALFCNTIELNPKGCISWEIHPQAAVSVCWDDSRGDFWSTEYQMSARARALFDEKDFKPFVLTGPA